jgi:hypothetical protein
LDNLQRVAIDAKSQRCLSRRDTAALSEILEVQAGDATDASLSGSELRAASVSEMGGSHTAQASIQNTSDH